MLVVVQVDSKSAGIRTKTFHKQERREGEKESIFARVQQAIVVLSFWRYFPGKMPKFQRYRDTQDDDDDDIFFLKKLIFKNVTRTLG